MKIRGEYVLDSVGEERIAVPLDSSEKRVGIIKLNAVGAFLWELLKDGAEEEELVQALTDRYTVDDARAAEDVKRFLANLDEHGVLEK